MRVATRRLMSSSIASAMLGLALCTSALAALGAGSIKPGTWHGAATATGQPNGSVQFTVSSTTTTNVVGFAGSVFGNCTLNGSTRQINISLDPTTTMAVSHKKFGFHGNFNIRNGTVVIAKHVIGKISGKFVKSKAASGTMSFSWKFDANAPTGFSGARCKTGTVSWTAAPK